MIARPDPRRDPSTARVAALPRPLPFPDSPELGDRAWERRRKLFGRD